MMAFPTEKVDKVRDYESGVLENAFYDVETDLEEFSTVNHKSSKVQSNVTEIPARVKGIEGRHPER